MLMVKAALNFGVAWLKSRSAVWVTPQPEELVKFPKPFVVLLPTTTTHAVKISRSFSSTTFIFNLISPSNAFRRLQSARASPLDVAPGDLIKGEVKISDESIERRSLVSSCYPLENYL